MKGRDGKKAANGNIEKAVGPKVSALAHDRQSAPPCVTFGNTWHEKPSNKGQKSAKQKYFTDGWICWAGYTSARIDPAIRRRGLRRRKIKTKMCTTYSAKIRLLLESSTQSKAHRFPRPTQQPSGWKKRCAMSLTPSCVILAGAIGRFTAALWSDAVRLAQDKIVTNSSKCDDSNNI